jgi:hypothetical protein
MPAFITFPTPTQLQNLLDPSANTDAVTKQYVDLSLSNVSFDSANTANTKVSKAGDTITGIINITNATNSNTYNTGSLIITGGVGVGANIFTQGIFANNYYGTFDGGVF